jgi:hypothetical protein
VNIEGRLTKLESAAGFLPCPDCWQGPIEIIEAFDGEEMPPGPGQYCRTCGRDQGITQIILSRAER